jgi:myo-inositol catabolism protein IolC
MKLGYDGDLYILAFDHRGSFQKKMFGIGGKPTPEEAAKIRDAKSLIFEGFEAARSGGKLPAGAGILVDEEFGTAVVEKAKKNKTVVAMPCEKSGQDEFDFEYGDKFGEHIERFDPSFAKVLVRYNTKGDAGMNQRQTARLKTLSDWLHKNNRKFLFELLVPATTEQLATVANDQDRYDREIRPGLVVDAITTMQDAGVEADVWKIEGLDKREDCERVSATARRKGRSEVICVVLGRGASRDKVDHWLKTGAGVAGYRGFAIGRTIWWDALAGFLKGSIDRAAAAKQIAANYTRSIAVYTGTGA